MESTVYAIVFVILGVLALLLACGAVAAIALGFDRVRKILWVRYPLDDSKRHRAHFCLWAGKKKRLHRDL